MNCLLVGFGTAARAHMAAYRGRLDVDVVAIVDPSPQSRAIARNVAPDAHVVDDVCQLPRGLAIDVADICCPPRWHADETVAALGRGSHVLCEKPLFLGLDEARKVRAAVATASGALYPSHNYKFAPVVQQMRAAVIGQRLGSLERAIFRTLRPTHARGTDAWHPDWRRDPHVAGGGILQDHGTHAAYLATYLTGLRVEWVSCTTENTFESEHSAALTMGLVGGLEVEVELSWRAPHRHTSYLLQGTAGSASFDTVRYRQNTSESSGEWASGFEQSAYPAWFSSMFDDFLLLVRDRSRQEDLLAEAEQAAAVIAAAYQSAARNGARIQLDQVLIAG